MRHSSRVLLRFCAGCDLLANLCERCPKPAMTRKGWSRVVKVSSKGVTHSLVCLFQLVQSLPPVQLSVRDRFLLGSRSSACCVCFRFVCACAFSVCACLRVFFGACVRFTGVSEVRLRVCVWWWCVRERE